jgi:hypothetical protein
VVAGSPSPIPVAAARSLAPSLIGDHYSKIPAASQISG